MAMATRSYLSIGEVLVALKAEFPDITISKIRFLEGEGLIEPERTPSGYRKFYETDIERLRSILKMQRDEYLPLKVIKERLARQDAGESPEGPAIEAKVTDDEIVEPPTGLQMSVEEMSTATGVEPRHLTMYRHFAEREASFFEAIVLPVLRQKNPDARRTASATLTDLAKMSRKLKQALLRTNLRQYLTASGA